MFENINNRPWEKLGDAVPGCALYIGDDVRKLYSVKIAKDFWGRGLKGLSFWYKYGWGFFDFWGVEKHGSNPPKI